MWASVAFVGRRVQVREQLIGRVENPARPGSNLLISFSPARKPVGSEEPRLIGRDGDESAHGNWTSSTTPMTPRIAMIRRLDELTRRGTS
jgi:hypothetical protein